MIYRLALITTNDAGEAVQDETWWETSTFAGWWCDTCDCVVREAEDVWIGDVAVTICGHCGAERHVTPTIGVGCPRCDEDVRDDDFIDHISECGT